MKTQTTYLIALVTFAAALVGFPAGCATTQNTSDDDLNILSTRSELIELLADDRSPCTLIDVRQAEQFAEAHILGAINIPIRRIVGRDPRLAEATNLIVYSDGWTRSSDDLLSWAAAKKLLALDYQNVYDFRGGLDLWIREGGQLADGGG